MGLVGESGSGARTVTAMMVSGLLRPNERIPGPPSCWTARICSTPAAAHPCHSGAGHLRGVSGSHSAPWTTGCGSVSRWRVPAGHTDLSAPQERKQRALQALRDVELPGPGSIASTPRALSGGAPAGDDRAHHCGRPVCCWRDKAHPTAGRHPFGPNAGPAEAAEQGDRMSILFISTQPPCGAWLCTRVAVMEKGSCIVETGPVDQIFFHRRLLYQRLIARHSLRSYERRAFWRCGTGDV